MSETNETEDKTARGRKMTLNLRRTVESGHVRQSFSHGRSKSVLVEKKKRRAVGAGGTAPIAEEAPVKAPPVAEVPQKKPRADDTQSRRSGVVLRQLSDEEKDARIRALSDSKVREAEERERAEAEAAHRAVTEDVRVKEREEADERQVKEQARLATEAEARRKGEDTARKHLTNEVEEAPKRGALDDRHSKKERVAPKRANEQRVRGRLTITNALDEEQRQRSSGLAEAAAGAAEEADRGAASSS